jgi:hypothetical protein
VLQSPDPDADNWMTKAETCRLYELVPTQVPLVSAGNKATIQHARAGHKR